MAGLPADSVEMRSLLSASRSTSLARTSTVPAVAPDVEATQDVRPTLRSGPSLFFVGGFGRFVDEPHVVVLLDFLKLGAAGAQLGQPDAGFRYLHGAGQHLLPHGRFYRQVPVDTHAAA